jgi:branched-chain amino acid transport system permease protein
MGAHQGGGQRTVPVESAEAVVDGMMTGAVYALAACGFTLAYDAVKVPNLAQGSFLKLAMLLGWLLAGRFGIIPYASLPLVSLVMFAAGYGLGAGIARPVSRGRRGVAMGLTAGLALALEAAVFAVAGTVPRTVRLPHAALLGAAGAVMVGGMLFVFMTRTDTGRSIRAVASEPVASQLVGIRPGRVRAVAYGVSAACAGAAGCLLLPGATIDIWSGPRWLVVSWAAALLGGLGSIRGAVVGGVVVGIAEKLAGPPGIGAVLLAAVLLRVPAWQLRQRGADA